MVFYSCYGFLCGGSENGTFGGAKNMPSSQINKSLGFTGFARLSAEAGAP